MRVSFTYLLALIAILLHIVQADGHDGHSDLPELEWQEQRPKLCADGTTGCWQPMDFSDESDGDDVWCFLFDGAMANTFTASALILASVLVSAN